MNELERELIREFFREYIRRGMDSGSARYHAEVLAHRTISRMESGAPEEYWTAGMDGWFKNLFKKIKKPFKTIGKKVFKPVIKQIARLPKNIERHILRPIAHWKYLSLVASIVPGYGEVLSLAIASAQTARSIHVADEKRKKALVDFERQAAMAYRQYQTEALRANVQPLTFAEFKNALISQTSF